jgi:hypothetical protein
MISLFALIAFNSRGTNLAHLSGSQVPLFDVFGFEYLPLKDTIHLLSDVYVEISLEEQEAILHRRNDSSLHFRVSTGNAYIAKGKSTPEGIFTVQGKSREATSKQFENAKLFHWIGFNGNIGFHGLEGSGYYRHLGLRPSSHGCVRIGRDDAEKLYQNVRKGTPVIVHSGEPAVIMKFSEIRGFCPNRDFFLANDRKILSRMRNRMKNLYKGTAIGNNYGRIFMDGTNPLKLYGFDIGKAENLAIRQVMPLNSAINYSFDRADNVFTSTSEIILPKDTSLADSSGH